MAKRDMPPWRVTTKQAAAELGMTVPTIIYLMRMGQLPIGTAYRQEGAVRHTVIIYRKSLDAYKKARGIV